MDPRLTLKWFLLSSAVLKTLTDWLLFYGLHSSLSSPALFFSKQSFSVTVGISVLASRFQTSGTQKHPLSIFYLFTCYVCLTLYKKRSLKIKMTDSEKKYPPLSPDAELHQRNLGDPVIPASVAVTVGLDVQLSHRAQQTDLISRQRPLRRPTARPAGTRDEDRHVVCVCVCVGWLGTHGHHICPLSCTKCPTPSNTHTLYHSASSLLCPPHQHRCCSCWEASEASTVLSIISTHILRGTHTHTPGTALLSGQKHIYQGLSPAALVHEPLEYCRLPWRLNGITWNGNKP